jgi:hypothetical protein
MTAVAVPVRPAPPRPVSLHPVLAFADAVDAALEDVAGIDPVFMATGEKAEALLRLSRLVDRLAAVRLRVLAVADDVAEAATRPLVVRTPGWPSPSTAQRPPGRSSGPRSPRVMSASPRPG